MTILAIETSCDDTCIAIVEADGRGLTRGFRRMKFNVLSNIISSQVKIHRKYGGVYPTLAKREHQRNLPLVLRKALGEAGFEIPNSQFLISNGNPSSKCQTPKIDLITVTVGPGLEPCLWTGVNFAKALACFWHLSIIPVNHIEAHIFANTINNQQSTINNFPAICLVVSGGHTQLILMSDLGKYKILGETRDDAAGECFDKVARILGLGYPGGPAIAAEAAKFKAQYQSRARCWTSPAPKQSFWCGVKNLKFKVSLPRPMINQKNFDFSFSGLKTAVLYDFKNRSPEVRQSKEYIQAMAAEVQQAIIDVLIKKTLKAAKKYQAKTIILGGGVVANKELRRQFKEQIKKEIPNIQYLIPNIQFCTDNAVMVGVAAYLHYLNPVAKKSCYGVKREVKNWENIKVNANLRI